MRASSNRLGDYLLLERLGVGGMAEVFVAEREGPYGFSKKVALKRILPGLAADKRFAEMFCDEARVSAALNHPNIVQVVDFGECDGELFMAMEYVHGLPVARLLRLAASAKRSIPVGIALHIIHEVLRGLHYAHEARDSQGRPLLLVHRDVSPGNILVGYSGEVKLTDFGIVKSEFVARRTYPGELKGKMGYMSPEQAAGLDLDRRSDLFTVGIVLAELLLLRPLFQGKNELETLTKIHHVDLGVLERHGQGLPRAVRSVLDRALQSDRDRRFATAGQFADAISHVARSEGLALNFEQLAAWLRDSGRPPAGAPSGALAGADAGVGAAGVGPRRAESGARRTARTASRERNVALRAAHGTSLGKVTLTELVGQVATGRIPLDALGSVNGGPWVPVSSLPGAAALHGRGAYQFGSEPRPERTAPEVKRYERRVLPGYLYDGVNKGVTGVFVVRSGERERRVFFQKGEIGFVSSTDGSELLGEFLTTMGIVSNEELDDCLLESIETGSRLGEILAARGHLRSGALARLLNQQREMRLATMLGWPSGSVAFFTGQQSGESVGPSPGRYALISAAVRRGFDDEVLAQSLSPFRDVMLRPRRQLDPMDLGFTAAELECLRLVLSGDGVTLKGILDTCHKERICRSREALLAVFIGLSSGLLQVVR